MLQKKFKPPAYELNSIAIDASIHQRYLLDDPIEDKSDPFVASQVAYDRTLVDMRKELLEVMTNRKSKILKVVLDIFNKL